MPVVRLEQRQLAGAHHGGLGVLRVVVPEHVEHAVHHEQGELVVERAGMRTLMKDQRVSYELEEDRRGKTSAVNLQSA